MCIISIKLSCISSVNFKTICCFIVSGDANFEMIYTGLTIGGFTQPSVARTVLELQTNAEKGFSQRFLWCIPKPKIVRFDDLQRVDRDFSASIGKLNTL